MSGPPDADLLQVRLSDTGGAWLRDALSKVSAEPDTIASVFPAVSRNCGREPLVADDDRGLRYGSVDDAARALLVQALPSRGVELRSLTSDLYRYGDANEKRGMLRACHLVDEPYGEEGIGGWLLPELHDALRSNDARLIAAAVQEYGAHHLGADAYRHAVVKCVFVGIPLAAVHGVERRQDLELARMLVDLADERMAAGREIPSDIRHIVAAMPHSLDRPELSAAVRDALQPATSTLAPSTAAAGLLATEAPAPDSPAISTPEE